MIQSQRLCRAQPPRGRSRGFGFLAGATALGLALAGVPGAAEGIEPDEEGPERKVHAIEVSTSPIIDGIFDDPVWQGVPSTAEFIQHKPHEGDAPSFQTSFKVVYDQANLYVAITLLDPEPELIVDRIHRRDQDSNTDWTGVFIDGYLDRRTGRFFLVNAGGVQQDGVISNDSNLDTAWDGVWESAVTIGDDGWRAELRIPLNALRFNEDGGPWGFEIFRNITRLGEQDFWSFMSLNDARFVSRFGVMDGVEINDAPLALEVSPYTSATEAVAFPALASDATEPGAVHSEASFRAGADLRYGITPQVTLDATVLPDFGQVEVDQAQINLTAFEVFFPEKRPFFLEGANIFDHPGDGVALFYSRRIGVGGGEILGATKLTGRTSGGLSFGLVEAVTGKQVYEFEGEDGAQLRYLADPVSNYAVGRVRQEIGNYGYVGTMVTAVNRPDRQAEAAEDLITEASYRDGYVGAVDFRFTDAQSQYRASGAVAGSRVTDPQGPRTGGVADISLAKDSGAHVVAAVHYDYVSPDADFNDLGYLTRRDQHSAWAWVQVRELDGLGPFRQVRVNGNVWGQMLGTAGVRRSAGGELGSYFQLPNFSTVNLGGGYGFGGYDPYEARAGFDHLFYRTPEYWVWGEFNSDPRRTVLLSLGTTYGYDNFGGEAVNLRPAVQFQVGRRGELEFGGYLRAAKEEVYWVENLDGDSSPEIYEPQPVFGRQATSQGDLFHRGMVTFTRNLSLQYFTQFQISKVDWREYYLLQDDGSLGEQPSPGYSPDPRSLARTNYAFFQANVRLRWEYRPGSQIYLVWTQQRFDDGQAGSPLDERLAEAFKSGSANAFVFKLSYRWGAEDLWPRSMFASGETPLRDAALRLRAAPGSHQPVSQGLRGVDPSQSLQQLGG